MPTEKKKGIVEGLTERLSRCTIAILTVPTGLSVAEMNALRRKLREAGVEFKVVKNTLAHLAAQAANKEALDPLLTGPTAIAFGYEDQSRAAKSLVDHIQSSRIELRIKGGILDNRLLSPEEIRHLANLPAREVLVAQLVGGLQSPLARLILVLRGNLVGLLNVLQARAKSLEGQEATT
jgi:large subunit ribosomal protein L10